nr:hypothetical protein [Tanacetum cinerariifolium]
MSSLFADTHNVVAILEKSDAAEDFEQIIDFLSRSYIHHALTVNPHIYIHIYISCIKQFWNTASVKRSNDVTRLQALVDKKKIMISEVVIRKILQLNDAEGIVCLSNEEIFAGLGQMGYEKPSTKLTFYKAFFSSQWKFLIHTLLGMSLARRWILHSKFYMYPRFIQLIIQNQVGDLSTHTTRFISPTLTQKVFANMKRVGKGFSGVETPLFEGMLAVRQLAEEGIAKKQVQADDAVAAAIQENVAEDGAEFPTYFQKVLDTCSALTQHVENLKHDKAAQKLEIIKLKARVKRLERANKVKSSKLRRLKKVGASKRIESSDDIKDVFNQGRMINELDKEKGIELVVDQVKNADIAKTEGRHAAKQAEKQAELYHLDLDHPSKVLIIAAYTRRRKGVIIRDPEEELSLKTPANTPKLKDKGKGILIETPKPMKKKDQIELDAEYARKLHEEINKDHEEINKDHEEINKDIYWDVAIDHVRCKYEVSVQVKRGNGGRRSRAKDLKKNLEVVDDEDDDVFTEATLLARKVPVVDYQIVLINNKPRFKIIKADETQPLYISFITLLKNFDREDLENL